MPESQRHKRAVDYLTPWRVITGIGVMQVDRHERHVVRQFVRSADAGEWTSRGQLFDAAERIALQHESFGECLSRQMDIECVDDLIHQVDQMRHEIASLHDSGWRGVASDLEHFVRKLVVSFDSCGFEAVCAVFERLALFLEDRTDRAAPPEEDPVATSFERYQSALEEANFTAAEDAVHRYFDLALPGLRARSAGSGAEFAAGAQFAPLCLAAAQHRFGHKVEAGAALDEAITIAQQVGDEEFQRTAAGWVAEIEGEWHVLASNPTTPEAGLALARREITTLGIGRDPEHRLRRVRGHVATATRCNSASDQTRVDGLLLLSAAWTLEGGHVVAASLAQMALGQCPPAMGMTRARALCAAQTLRFDAGEPVGALQAVLQAAAASAHGDAYLPTATDLSLRLAVARGQVRVAKALADRLAGAEVDRTDQSLSLGQIRCLIMQRDFTGADRAAAHRVQVDANQRRTSEVMEALLLRAEAHLGAGSATTALPSVLSALSFATSLHCEPQRWRASGMLARVHLGLAQHEDALRTLRGILPAAQHAPPSRVRGELYLVHAQCMFEADPQGPYEVLETDPQGPYEVLEAELRRARRNFALACETRLLYDTEVLAAKIADRFSRRADRDAAAGRARGLVAELRQAAEVSPSAVLAALNALSSSRNGGPET